MKAVQFKAYGGTEKLFTVDLPRPEPAEHQLVVEVMATSINPIDWKLHGGMLRWIKPLRFPSIPCFDIAGAVYATGPGAADFVAGERVFGMMPIQAFGAAAEYAVIDSRLVARMPETLSFQEVAGLPLAGMTALQALRDQGKLQASRRLLVVGAAGGVGHYAVQLGKLMKAHVTGICSTRNVDWVGNLGADKVVDYTQADDIADEEPFDVILDAVTNQAFSHWRPVLAERGVYVSLLPTLDLGLQAVKLNILSSQRIKLTVVKANRADLEYLAEIARQGLLRTVIDQVYSLDELGQALEKSRAGHARGKIIVSIKQ